MPHLLSRRTVLTAALAPFGAMAVHSVAHAEEAEPDHVRGQIQNVDGSSLTLKTSDGKSLRLAFAEKTGVFTLSKANYSSVDFGQYVGSVAIRLDLESPIVRATPRETISWLYQCHEIRIIDEKLRGIAVGFKKWDFPKGSSVTHGWVDDMDSRVVSIKYGPTQDEESDVLVGKDAPVTRMSPGERGDVKAGAHAFIGAKKDADGKLGAVFVFVGKDGLVPSL